MNDGNYLLNSYLEVLRTTRQRWWQIWKPRPNAAERAVIAAYQAESRFTCLYTGPMKKDNDK
jgi:hypothetical protein